MTWHRISSRADLPPAHKFYPIATAGATTIHYSTGLWLPFREEVLWHGVDGVRIRADVIAWYQVPPLN